MNKAIPDNTSAGRAVQYRNDSRVIGVLQQAGRMRNSGFVVAWNDEGAAIRGVKAEFVEAVDLTLINEWATLDDTRETYRHRVNDQSPWIDGLPAFQIQRRTV